MVFPCCSVGEPSSLPPFNQEEICLIWNIHPSIFVNSFPLKDLRFFFPLYFCNNHLTSIFLDSLLEFCIFWKLLMDSIVRLDLLLPFSTPYCTSYKVLIFSSYKSSFFFQCYTRLYFVMSYFDSSTGILLSQVSMAHSWKLFYFAYPTVFVVNWKFDSNLRFLWNLKYLTKNFFH